MKLLMLGVKEYPYGISSKFEKHSGGGIAKVVIDLVHELSKNDNVTYISMIVRRMPGQPRFERYDKLLIYRVSWVNSRYLRIPVFSFFSFFQAIRLLRKHDIVHAHGGFASFTAILLSFFYRNKTYLSSPHGGPINKESLYHPIATYLFSKLEIFNLKYSSNVVFLSEAEKQQLCSYYGILPASYFVVPTGISRLHLENRISDKFNLTFIGRLMPRKGVDKLIKACKILYDEGFDNFTITIVGDGLSRLDLINLAKSLGVESIIEFIGFSRDIEKYLGRSSLFILPSDGGEGLPISVLEAMSCGVPVMISNFEAPFNNNSYIKLVNNNPETIAAVVQDIFLNRIDLNVIGDNGKREYDAFYSIESAVERYLILYSSLLNR